MGLGSPDRSPAPGRPRARSGGSFRLLGDGRGATQGGSLEPPLGRAKALPYAEPKAGLQPARVYFRRPLPGVPNLGPRGVYSKLRGDPLPEEVCMSVSRRRFVRTVGVGSAGLSTSFIIGRGREAMAFESGHGPAARRWRLHPHQFQRERAGSRTKDNRRASEARSPLAWAAAIRRTTPATRRNDRRDSASARDRVIVGTGSGPILEAATRAFCAMDKPLVTAAPTFATCEQTARRIGAPVKAVQVDRVAGARSGRHGRRRQGRRPGLLLQPEQPDGHSPQRRDR